MANLDLRVPPVVLVAAAATAMWLIRHWVPARRFDLPGQTLLAFAIAFLGVVFCGAGVIQFQRARTTVNPMNPASSSSLVTRGIYCLTRNPMYLGFALMLFGWGLYLGNWLFLLVLAGFISYMTRFQIIPEERALGTLFGRDFEAYRRKVRRWI